MEDCKCKAEGCSRKMVSQKHRLCKAHLNRFYRTGTVGEGKIAKKRNHNPYFGLYNKKLEDK